MEQIFDRIYIDANVCNGKPIIRGKRISVQTIMEFLSAGETSEEILRQYPSLEAEDITACMRYATELMNHSFIIKQAALLNRKDVPHGRKPATFVFIMEQGLVRHISVGNMKMKELFNILNALWPEILKLNEEYKPVNVFPDRIEGIK